MSKLLHSKTFRNNLFKWIMIYICVMLSTFSVITYSKYISGLQGESSAVPAKFILSVEKGDICSAVNTEACNLEKYKPYEDVDYNFSVNTLEMEVKTLLIITINVNDSFNINKLFVDDQEIDLANSEGYTVLGNTITITDTVGLNNTYNKNYKVRLSFDENSSSNSIADALTINYAATQIN